MDLTNEQIEHPVFGTGRVINQDDKRITIQFSEETGEKIFMYPDAFEKYLNMCNPAAAQKVKTDLLAKAKQIEKQRQKEKESARRIMESVALATQKRKSSPTAKLPTTKQPKTKAKTKAKAKK